MLTNTYTSNENAELNIDLQYRTFCVQRVRDLMEQADTQQADLIYRFARGLLKPRSDN